MHALQAGSATGYLAQAARLIARQSQLARDDETRLLVLQVLLDASEHAEPQPRDDDAAAFDESETWGSPTPRVDATDGLMRLASRTDYKDDGVTDIIERLARDPSAVVRYHVARAACILASGQPELAWNLLDRLANDDSLAVRNAVVSSLSYMCSLDRHRVIQTTKSIFANAGEKKKSIAVRISALNVVHQSLRVVRG